MFGAINFGDKSPSWFFKILKLSSFYLGNSKFSKMHSRNLSQIALPNMWLLVRIVLNNIILHISLREKCANTEFFLVRIFPHLDWIRKDTYLSVLCPNAGKYRPEKTPYLDTFHTYQPRTSLTVSLQESHFGLLETNVKFTCFVIGKSLIGSASLKFSKRLRKS